MKCTMVFLVSYYLFVLYTVSSCSNSRCSVCYVDDVDAVVVFTVVVVVVVDFILSFSCKIKIHTEGLQKHQNLSLSN